MTDQTPDAVRTRKLAIAFITIAAIIGGTYWLTQKNDAVSQPVQPGAAQSTPVPTKETRVDGEKPAGKKEDILKVQKDDIIYGKADAPVTIYEYASLSCSHCARFQKDMLPQLEEKYITPGKVKLVHRFFPLNEPALRASQLVVCAKDQSHAFIKVLFNTQDQWAFDPSFRESLARIAGVGGMSREAFDACLADKTVEQRVLQSRKDGEQGLKVQSTPTFFVGEQVLTGEQTIENFSATIDPLLK